MSQGTPSKEGRVERHLMRQRGAGVRTIKADFGFSFALPTIPAVAQLHLPAEPPAKRRRTNESISPKRWSDNSAHAKVQLQAEVAEQPVAARNTLQDHVQHGQTNQEDQITTAIEVELAGQAPKPTKKPARARRKLCLDDEAEQQALPNNGTASTGALEDTFIFSPKPKKRQPRRKQEEGVEIDDLKQKTKKTAPKAKKGAKARQQLDDKLESGHTTVPAAEAEEPEKNPKTTNKETDATRITAPVATVITKPIEVSTDHGTNHGSDDPTKPSHLPGVSPIEAVGTKSKTVRPKQAPRKTLKRSIEEVATNVKGVNTAAPEKPAKRPRRQAAISATAKVAMGYEDDLIPVDKLRRAPDVDVKPRKSRKANAHDPPATASPLVIEAGVVIKDPQDCDKDEPPSSPPVVVKRGRKPGIKAAEGRACKSNEKLDVEEILSTEYVSRSKEKRCAPSDEPPRSSKVPAKRGRKPGAKARKIDAATHDVKSQVIVPHSTKHASPTKDEGHATEEQSPISPKLPAKRGRPPGVKARKADAAMLCVEPEVTGSQSTKHASPTKGEDRTTEDEPPLLSKLPAKRGRPPGAKGRKAKVATDNMVPEAMKSESTKQVSPTKDEDDEPNEQSSHSPKLPVKRGRKPGVKARKADASDKTSPTVAAAATGLVSQEESAVATQPEDLDNDSSKVQSERTSGDVVTGSVESLQKANIMGEQPTKPRRALADFDGNIVRKSSTVEGKKQVQSAFGSASPPAKHQSRLRKMKTEVPVKPKATCSLDAVPSHDTTTTPRKRHIIAVEEDLDWLFEKPETKRSRPAIVRPPATKTRLKESDQSAKDMDLDDLLASVAGFSGKLLTGRRGRVVG